MWVGPAHSAGRVTLRARSRWYHSQRDEKTSENPNHRCLSMAGTWYLYCVPEDRPERVAERCNRLGYTWSSSLEITGHPQGWLDNGNQLKSLIMAQTERWRHG